MERNGGSAADIDHYYLAAGGATTDERGGARFYVINVLVGSEVAAEERYGNDPDVYLAVVNQEEIGHYTVPDTAVKPASVIAAATSP